MLRHESQNDVLTVAYKIHGHTKPVFFYKNIFRGGKYISLIISMCYMVIFKSEIIISEKSV